MATSSTSSSMSHQVGRSELGGWVQGCRWKGHTRGVVVSALGSGRAEVPGQPLIFQVCALGPCASSRGLWLKPDGCRGGGLLSCGMHVAVVEWAATGSVCGSWGLDSWPSCCVLRHGRGDQLAVSVRLHASDYQLSYSQALPGLDDVRISFFCATFS